MFRILAILIGTLLSGSPAPADASLDGKWGCVENFYVFTDKEGKTPDKGAVDGHLLGMGVTRDNCVLTFSGDHKLNFRVGEKAFDMDWTLDPSSKEFKTVIGLFTLKGNLIKQGDRIVMVYSRPNLFLMMRVLCSPSGKKHIAPLGELLDCCKGLTLAMVFEKQ